MTDRLPSLAALRAFAAVAHHGSFARAAASLHVSTSAVSHQVRGLEADLGVTLLSRARNGTGLTQTAVTEAGRDLLAAIQPAFAQLGAACEMIRRRGARPTLAISANGSVASLWLAPLLAEFAARHPSVAWQMRTFEDEPDMLREGLDLAILLARPGARQDGEQLLFAETVFPVCAPALRLSGRPEALLAHNLLEEAHGTSWEKSWSTWLDKLGLGTARRATVVRFDTFAAAIAAAMAGAGVALGRAPLLGPALASGALVRPFGDVQLPGSWDMVIRQRPGRERDSHVTQLRDFLLEAAAPSVVSPQPRQGTARRAARVLPSAGTI